MSQVAVIGAGSWGTAAAAILATNAETTLWARSIEVANEINDSHHNSRYLDGVALPTTLRSTPSLSDAVTGADLIVLAVPSHGLRAVVEAASGGISERSAVLSLSKGVEQATLLRMTEVIAEVLPSLDRSRIGVLTGPNLANEVAVGQPTASVAAFADQVIASQVQALFTTPTFRVYTNLDVVGCEIAGALKNVIAIGVGMAHGLGYGDNAKAALITRGLAELSRLGAALGGDPKTFAGLAGMGDLIATCASPHSRNRSVGIALGQGRAIGDIIAEMNMVAEGVKTTGAVLALAEHHALDMPVAQLVGRVLNDGAKPADLVGELMGRAPKSENQGVPQHG